MTPTASAEAATSTAALAERPALIALPETVDDVIAVVGFAREHGLRIVPQRTRPNAGPLGDIAGTLLLPAMH